MSIKQELTDHFRQYTVLDIPSIRSIFPKRSYPSFQRDLKALGCVNSYSHNGQFYTLHEIPVYDELGIWGYENIYFSRYGTAKSTAKQLVEQSSSGYTHAELQDLMGIRMYGTLERLVKEGSIDSERISGISVYLSSRDDIRREQVSNRNRPGGYRNVPFDSTVVIEVLLAVFIENKRSPDMVHRYLAVKGVSVPLKDIEAIFAHYDLGKKN